MTTFYSAQLSSSLKCTTPSAFFRAVRSGTEHIRASAHHLPFPLCNLLRNESGPSFSIGGSSITVSLSGWVRGCSVAHGNLL